jgi:alkylhydroperoxidase/carboxymuconolactone decarboxylase family protein YurZ
MMRDEGSGRRDVTAPAAGLDGETRALVRVAIAVAGGDTAALRERLVLSRALGVVPRHVDELLLQSMLNVGYALALQAFAVWREIVPAAEPAEGLSHERWSEWAARGAEVCGEVYGRTFHKLLVNLRALHPALEALVIVDAYGKLIGRDGLDLKRRELCTLAEIAVLDTPRQLHAHLRGALNTGSTAQEVDAVLALVEEDVDATHARRVRELWDDVKRRSLGMGEAKGGKDVH